MALVKKTNFGSVSSKAVEQKNQDVDGRTNWHAWLIAVFAILTLLAFTQQPKPAPYRAPSSLERFFYPYERNAFARLPLITGRINNVHHVANTNTLWLVGDAGLILVSRDAGKSWQQKTFVNGPELDELSVNAEGQWPSVISAAHASVEGEALASTDIPDEQKTIPQNQQRQQRQQGVPQGSTLQQQSLQQQPLQQQPSQQNSRQQPRAEQFDTGASSENAEGGRVLPGDDIIVPVPASSFPSLFAVKFLNPTMGVIVGESGTVLITRDAGESWSLIEINSFKDLYDLHLNAQSLIVVGAEGAIFEADRPFDRFVDYSIQDNPDLFAVNENNYTAIIVGGGDTILYRSDGGKSNQRWKRLYVRNLGRNNNFYDIAITEADAGIVVGDQGVSDWDTRNTRYSPRSGVGDAIFKGLTAVANNRFIAVGENGSLAHITVGLDAWQTIGYKAAAERTDINSGLNAISAFGRDRILAVGDEGVLLQSNDNGLSWFRASIDVAFSLAADSQSQETAGDQIISHEQAQLALRHYPYSKLPAPWYWLVCLLAAAASFFLTRQKPLTTSVDHSSSITDALASDKPLEPNQPDPLKFGTISKGLSRFIRNPSTKPPLTTAIIGQWGTGKSSLMNLLYHDLKDYGFTPVWFNAWHHQKGEQLLASLYANIRTQAIPSLFHFSAGVPIGLLFRIKLLINRMKRNRALSLLLLLIFMGPALYFLYGIETSLEEFWASLRQGESEGFKTLLIAVLGSTPLAALLRTLQGFGVDPIKLVSLSAAATSPDTKVDPSARQKFAADFKQVTESLELGRMVIFIDDLDRCSKENVVDILEAINFLSVSGNCYIVLGMDEKWVKLCVTDHFEKIAQDDPKFADNYLEKMINIKVPVPPLGKLKVQSFLAPVTNVDLKESTKGQHWVTWLHDKLKPVYKPLTLGVLIGAAYFVFNPTEQIMESEATLAVKTHTLKTHTLKTWNDVSIDGISFENGQPKISLGLSDENTPDSVATQNAGSNTVNNHEAYDLKLIVESTEAQLRNGFELGQLGDGSNSPMVSVRLVPSSRVDDLGGEDRASTAPVDDKKQRGVTQFYKAKHQTSWLIWSLPIVVIIGLIWGLVIWAMKRPDRIVTDSADFNDALGVWQEWILQAHQTPRGLKRFLNNIRYLAMRYRSEPEPEMPSVWKSIRGLFVKESATFSIDEQRSDDAINEAELVALSAIYALDPSYVTDDQKYSMVLNGDALSLFDNASEPNIKLISESEIRFSEAHKTHKHQFSKPISNSGRDKFLEILGAS